MHKVKKTNKQQKQWDNNKTSHFSQTVKGYFRTISEWKVKQQLHLVFTCGYVTCSSIKRKPSFKAVSKTTLNEPIIFQAIKDVMFYFQLDNKF